MIHRREMAANVCKRKGADPDTLETMMEDIEVLGHRQIVFKSDHENLVKEAARRADMKLENSPKHRSAANGMVEITEQRVFGRTTVFKDALEANIKQMIEPSTPVMTFMVNHAATIINRLSMDQDGKTQMGESTVPANA